MTSTNLRRYGALLIVAGVVLAISYAFFPSHYDPLIRWTALGSLVGTVLAVPGLLAFQAGQRARSRKVGWASMAFLVIGLCLLELPHSVIGVVDLDRMKDLDAYHASIWGSLEFFGLVMLMLGMLTLTIAMFVADSYPSTGRWLLVANIVVSVVSQSVPSLGDALQQPALNYLLMGLLGVAMIQAADGTHDPARSSAPHAGATTSGAV